jgi:hypothetical protein
VKTRAQGDPDRWPPSSELVQKISSAGTGRIVASPSATNGKLKQLITSEEFEKHVTPELLRRWEIHCYCRNQKFLKLISFDFHNYKAAPIALIDAELIINGIIFKRFEPVRGWITSEGGADRLDRCPQCGEIFKSRYDQYSINMDRTTTRPCSSLPVAQVGDYVAGFYYFTKYEDELQRIIDFQVANSVAEFIDSITNVGTNAFPIGDEL